MFTWARSYAFGLIQLSVMRPVPAVAIGLVTGGGAGSDIGSPALIPVFQFWLHVAYARPAASRVISSPTEPVPAPIPCAADQFEPSQWLVMMSVSSRQIASTFPLFRAEKRGPSDVDDPTRSDIRGCHTPP